MLNSPFQPAGKSFSISVGAANQVTAVALSDLGLTQTPSTMRLINNGTADVWITFGNVNNPVAAFPVAGTVTTGTPQAGLRLKPGAIETFEVPTFAANVPTVANPNVLSSGLWIATIGAAAGPVVDVSFGEGI